MTKRPTGLKPGLEIDWQDKSNRSQNPEQLINLGLTQLGGGLGCLGVRMNLSADRVIHHLYLDGGRV
jgi:hypothetical protein